MTGFYIKYFKFFPFPVLFLFFSSVQAQWHGIDTLNCIVAYNDIHFVNDSTGYIGGSCGMKKTTDGGNTWDVMTTGNYSSYDDFYFFNKDTGLVFAEYDVLKTTDGGDNWGFKFSEGIPSNFSFPFNDSIGFMASSVPFGYPSTIYKTTDFGDTWSMIGNLTYSTIDENWIERIFFVDYKTGFAGSDNGKLYKTVDGGVNWSLNSFAGGGTFEEIYFIDTSRGFLLTSVGGFPFPSSGGIYSTHNGGISWDTIVNNIGAATAIEMFDSIGFLSMNKEIMKSTDMGQTWNTEWTSQNSIQDISFVNDSTGYAFDYDSIYARLKSGMQDTTGNDSTDNNNFAWAFPDSGIVWCQTMGWGNPTEVSGGIDHKIFPDGSDTTINGLKYIKLFHTGSRYNTVPGSERNYFSYVPFGFFRNDTLNQKVEFRTIYGDVTIYDFDLNVGDTIFSFERYPEMPVKRIDTIWMGGISRRVYYYGDDWRDGYIIQGIGPYTGLGEDAFSGDLDYGAQLECLTLGDSSYKIPSGSPTSLPFYTETECNWCRGFTGISKAVYNHKLFTIYPNPASEQVLLKIQSPIQNAILKIMTIYGQVVNSKVLNNRFNENGVVVDVSSFEPGTYFVILETNSDLSITKLFVIR